MYDQVEIIFRTIEYIEAHLRSETTIIQIAESVGYSLFHFIRTFNRVIHYTPYDYIIRRRLSEAALLLTGSKQRMIDISQTFCFKNQESFSRAFRRMFDMQPSQWREKGINNPLTLLPNLTMADLQYINSDHFHYPEIEELEDVLLSGLMTRLDENIQNQERLKHEIYADLCSVLPDMDSMQFVELNSLIGSNRKNPYIFIGVKKDGLFQMDACLSERRLPSGCYAKICIPADEIRLAANYLYHTWFPKSGYKPAGQVEAVFYKSPFIFPFYRTLYIPAVIRNLKPDIEIE